MDNNDKLKQGKFRTSYLVNMIGGMAFVKEATGKWIDDPQEIRRLIIGFERLLSVINSDSVIPEQGKLRSEHARNLVELIAMGESAKWHFRPQEIKTTSPCVYFIRGMSGGYENFTKIGSTKRLTSRVLEVSHDHLDYDFEVVAYVETDRYRDLEKLYHYQLESARVFGEFFRYRETCWYLAYLEQLLADKLVV